MTKPGLQYIDISLLQPNPFQPRNKIKSEDIEELASSIALHGVLEPLVVAQTPAGLQIIAGERRWRASQKAGLKEVPIILKEVTPSQMLEMALIENVQRTDLNPLERAQAIQQLVREFGMQVVDVARRISKSGAYVSNSLRLLTLPDAIKDGISGNLITEGHARALAAIDNPKDMIEAYKELLKSHGTVRDAEELARNWKEAEKLNRLKGIKRTVLNPKDPEAIKWEQRLQEIIRKRTTVKSKIKLSRSSTQTKIVITLQGSQVETQQALMNFMALTQNELS